MFVTISLLLAAACLLPAAGKLTGQPKMRKSAAHFGIPWPRYRLIGVAELAAAAGILIGLWWHPLGLAAADSIVSALMASSFSRVFSAGCSAREREGQVGQGEEEGQQGGRHLLGAIGCLPVDDDGADEQQGHPGRRGHAEGVPPQAGQDACGGG